ncbi:MAG: DUF4421 family protein [Aequorivita sp.]|nr:DUF4421 family protein [Aequorivita sp.]
MTRQAIIKPFKLTVFVSLFSFISMLGQTEDSISVKNEAIWIEKINDKIGLDVSVNNSYEIFEVKTTDSKFILYPNTASNLRLNVNYRFFSFGFQFTPDFIPGNGDNDIKGKTKSFEFRSSFIFKHWFTDISYSKVKGYYLKNSDDFTTILDGDPYIQFPNLNYYGFNTTVGYSSNSKFSFKSLTSQTERQLKSAGSFIPVINLGYYVIDDKSSEVNTQKSNNFESSIGPGYAYTIVANKKYYLSLSLLTSVGYLNTKLTTRQVDEDIKTNQDNFIFRWDGKVGLGYNGEKIYTGLYTNISGTNYKQENTTAMNFKTRIFYHFFLGVRISAPSYIERKANKIETLFRKQSNTN